MIPLHDENPRYRTPYVNYCLIALNVAVFAYELSLGRQGLTQFFVAHALVPQHLTSALGAVERHHPVAPAAFWPLITNMFMHGGWLHLFGNLLFLWIFGDNVEDRLGHFGYLVFYLLAGVVAGLTHAGLSPHSSLPSLGASGAIGGVLGAYIVLYPRARVLSLIFLGLFITTTRVPAWVFLGVWFVVQSLQGLTSLGAASTASHGGVAVWAHIGGFLAGTLVGAIARALPAPRPPRSPFADRWYSNR